MLAGSNRGVRRALIHRKRRYAGVTAGDGVIIPFMSQGPTMRPRPSGSKVLLGTTGGLFPFSFATENGPGPEGSSPTVDYRCSMGSGVEKVLGVLRNVMSANLGDPAFFSPRSRTNKNTQQRDPSSNNGKGWRYFLENQKRQESCTYRFCKKTCGHHPCPYVL